MVALLPFPTPSPTRLHFLNPPNSNPHGFPIRNPLYLKLLCVTKQSNFRFSATVSHSRIPISSFFPIETLKLHHPPFFHLAASAIFCFFFCFFNFRTQASLACPVPLQASPSATCQSMQDEGNVDAGGDSVQPESEIAENVEYDAEWNAALEKWKSKTYALTVPLRIIYLRGSIPPSWIKDFVQAQGRRLKLNSEFRGSLGDIFSDLSSAANSGHLEPKSAMAADIVTIGDSWLNLAINGGIIEPIHGVEGQDWFDCLSDKWKVYLRRNNKGELNSDGKIWGAPYRWGSMVIAYKKNKFKKHHLAPIEDWGDLWRPELAGKISMVDAPREVVGAVLKYMGASYNTKDIESQVIGGRNAVMRNLALLQRQVRLFDSVHYLKAFGAGDVWVAVGWSSDVIPAAKRLSNVAVIVPESGTSLWADLWAIPAATKFVTNRVGGRVRTASPLIHQWIEFCLQAARALPFKQEVVPGASPLSLEGSITVEGFGASSKGKPMLDTNLVSGKPPSEILARCEFLEPLSEGSLMDYQWLISHMQKSDRGWIKKMLDYVSSVMQTFGYKLQLR